MPQSFRSMADYSNAATGLSAVLAKGNGPPPSTLAAQLVENISASTKSARSDENSELKGLFAIIQKVKDNPELLKSPEDRLEHNHMLVYVYCRVVLDTIKLDDPFLDKSHVRTEAQKAINFLRFTINETPTVLDYRDDNNSLLFRGQDPLWIWLLPQLLRLLGHSKCIDLEGSIEGFLQYLLLVTARNGQLWGITSQMSLYLRAAFTGLCDHLQTLNLSSTSRDVKTTLELPPAGALDLLNGNVHRTTGASTTYKVSAAQQALRQASSVSRVLAYPLTCQDPAFSCIVPMPEIGPWLLDSWVDLRSVQRRWDAMIKSSPVPLTETALEIITASYEGPGISCAVKGKVYAALILLCSELVSSSDELTRPDEHGEHVRLCLCLSLLTIAKEAKESYVIGRLAASRMLRELTLLSLQNSTVGEQTDVWRCASLLGQMTSQTVPSVLDSSTHPSLFRSDVVRQKVEELELVHETPAPATTGTKRRKISVEEDGVLMSLYRTIHKTLSIQDEPSESGLLEEGILVALETASDSTRCAVIGQLAHVSCANDASFRKDSDEPSLECIICDNAGQGRKPGSSSAAKSTVRSIFSQLIRQRYFLESRQPRVSAMLAIRKLIYHCEDLAFVDIEVSSSAQWCLQSLNSSIRELRIAAGRSLAILMPANPTGYIDNATLVRNRKNSIALLKSASEADMAHMVESRVMAWGQIGRVVAEEELNLVLIKLLEYLGSNNSIEAAVAFNELLNVAEVHRMTPRRLLEPFWGSLAYMVTKDMIQKPQRSRAIAELLQISINELLLLIQSHALPWLVLDRQKDVIQKIAEARQEKEIWNPIMDVGNLPPVLSLLMVQETEDIEAFTKSRLNDISPHFHSLPLLDLIQFEPTTLATELLKAAAEADESRKQSSREALKWMATTILSTSKETRKQKGNLVGRFLQQHILGLMARVADVINDASAIHPNVAEQRIGIRTLEEMIKACQAHARIARPQISACLLSAIGQEPLRGSAFSCWATMLECFEEEDVEALLETTFFIVGRYWDSLSELCAENAKRMLTSLLNKHNKIIEFNISRLPSLAHIAALKQIESKLKALRPNLLFEEAIPIFTQRLSHENSGVVHQALTELVSYLRDHQAALYTSAVGQQPDSAVAFLLRALLDCACKYNTLHLGINRLCVESMGLIGCLDSNQVEAVREQRSIIVVDNFEGAQETTDFALFLLEEVLVPSFLSATDTRLQGFLCFAMQELLDRCDIKYAVAAQSTGIMDGNDIYRKWIALPETTREVVAPFLTSRYMVAPMAPIAVEYPIFHPGRLYSNWLRTFVLDLLRRGQHPHAELLFEPLTRVIRVKDLSTAEFLLPYLVLHIFLGPKSDDAAREQILNEITSILEYAPPSTATYAEREDIKRFSHVVFQILDYAMRWIHAKRSAGRLTSAGKESISRIQSILDSIPAELISQRAADSNEYARALFHLEQHAQKMEQQKREPGDRTKLLERLQEIYANIDEPDGLEGISSHLPALDITQQILGHKKAGRWSAAKTWYEMELAEQPDNVDTQVELLNCLKQAGQHDVLLNVVEGLHTNPANDAKIMPFAVEAAWVTGRWEILAKFTDRFEGSSIQDFNMSLASLFKSLHRKAGSSDVSAVIDQMRDKIATAMTTSSTGSLQAAHENLLKCHILTDLEILVQMPSGEAQHKKTLSLLDGRLEIIGAYYPDKQYLLGIRRAAMELLRPKFSDLDVSSLWLSSARLARKTNSLHQSFSAVLHASQLGDDAATIENAKLTWKDSHHRKAIQMLQGAIERNKFMTQASASVSSSSSKLNNQQRLLTARAQLLLAKWLDAAGQTHAGALREKYQQPPRTFGAWEKGHYYLGRHYKKVLESEQPLKVDDQSDNYITGEIARLVIENYVRSLNSGTKYLYQTLPRILTLWLELGAQVDKAPEGKVSLSRELHRRRVEQLNLLHTFLDKYIGRLPTFVFYTALPQIVARIAHPNSSVFDRLAHIIIKVVESYPRQALWSLISVMTTRQVSDRKTRGAQILQSLRNTPRKVEGTSFDTKHLLRTAEKLAEQLLLACHNGDFHGNKAVRASLSRDLRFNHKCTPCPLVVPVESSITATLPAATESMKTHRAFSRDVVSIDCFLDDVLVLSSLAKPRRLTARGSDGKTYMLLIKPKDDLRTDQRLMEFNGLINRSLKRDAESSRRQLYIRTYAVVPLNEECGIIEWVPGIKTMRDILLSLYASQKIHPDYAALKQLMEEASASDSKIRVFTDDVLGRFPPMLPLWFLQQFPNPSAWFAARLRYTRSCAVMSMVGTILGLGDRHGENVNLEEGNGGVFHVDFNCLFDKGLTFAKPERVPFRLTHNMVAAMGIYGYEGPFRKSSELTLSILRQQEETLMTILEAFIYDPTLDLQKDKRASRRGDVVVKLQPQSVVDSIKRKVKGLLPNESIPLSVEGQVEELIKQAVDPRNLTAMYIGWCPFL